MKRATAPRSEGGREVFGAPNGLLRTGSRSDATFISTICAEARAPVIKVRSSTPLRLRGGGFSKRDGTSGRLHHLPSGCHPR
jgi:hypothetical protein